MKGRRKEGKGKENGKGKELEERKGKGKALSKAQECSREAIAESDCQEPH